MATAKKSTPATSARATAIVKPVKEVLSKTALVNQIAEQAGVEAKSVKAVLAAQDAAIPGSVSKKGVGTFTLPGLLKLDVVKVRPSPSAMASIRSPSKRACSRPTPPSVKIKARALKKLKDAAL